MIDSFSKTVGVKAKEFETALEDICKALGIELIQPKEGDIFNIRLHQRIEIEGKGPTWRDKIVRTDYRGFRYKEYVRKALVVTG